MGTYCQRTLMQLNAVSKGSATSPCRMTLPTTAQKRAISEDAEVALSLATVARSKSSLILMPPTFRSEVLSQVFLP